MRRLLICFCIGFGLMGSVTGVEPIVKQPSENAGKQGTYQVQTEFPGNNYYVCVPSTYTDDNPAGLHIYFHGQNGQKGAQRFGQWKQAFLERFNLIGINMQYMDGDNARDTATKVLAARHAVAQVMADYKILQGRGVICCFSGGGLPSGLYYLESAAQGGAEWPYNHMALYSSNSRMGIQQKRPMSWAISVGEKEWSLAALGKTQGARFGDVIRQAEAHPDVYFNIIQGGGHTIHKVAVQKSAEIFNRQDIATSPLFYPADYPEKELQRLVLASNALSFAHVAKELKKLRKDKDLDAALVAKLDKIEAAVQQRVTRMLDLVKELSTKDPSLCLYYGALFARYVKKYDKAIEGELKDTLKGMDQKAVKKSLAAQQYFAKEYPSFFISDGRPELSNKIVPSLKQLAEELGPDDHLGQLCKEFLVYE